MNTQLVSYDLRAPGKNYSNLHAYLKNFGWAKPLESVWLIRTTLSAEQLRNGVLGHIDSNDKVLVVNVTGKEAAWKNLSPEVATWITNNL